MIYTAPGALSRKEDEMAIHWSNENEGMSLDGSFWGARIWHDGDEGVWYWEAWSDGDEVEIGRGAGATDDAEDRAEARPEKAQGEGYAQCKRQQLPGGTVRHSTQLERNT